MPSITKIQPKDTRPVKRKRVAAYARVSGGKEAQLHSLSSQISYYNSYIGSRGDWELAGIYADEALTGTKENRPRFQEMLNDCHNGKIDLILTKSLTRFARNTVTLLSTVRDLKALGIDVYFEKENIHSLSMDGELMLTLLASFAQEESRSASENQKWRIRKKFEQGLAVTGYMLGYRLKNGVLVVVPEEAEIVQQIFTDFLSGMGRSAIAKKLIRLQVPTRSGAMWSKSTVDGILQNEAYAGNLLLQKTYKLDHISKKKMPNHGELPKYYIENSHEAIISKTVFAAVQEEIKRRAEAYGAACTCPGEYLFTSLIRCTLCGRHYVRKLAPSSKKGHKKTVWICPTFTDYGKEFCPSQKIPEDILVKTTADVLGLPIDFDREMLMAHIREIQVPGHNRLAYVCHDGRRKEAAWQHKSRRESWTEEMKQHARERALKLAEERRRKCQTK